VTVLSRINALLAKISFSELELLARIFLEEFISAFCFFPQNPQISSYPKLISKILETMALAQCQ